MKNEISETFSLPISLIEEFDKIEFSKSHRNHALKFIHRLIKKSYKEYGLMDAYVELPANYLREVFNSKYNEWLKILISQKIINSTNSYSNINNNIYSKSYSINYINTFTPKMLPLFNKTPLKSVSYTYKKETTHGDALRVQNLVKEDLKLLQIPRDELQIILDEVLSEVQISNFKVGEDILKDFFMVSFNKGAKKYFMTKEKALKKAKDMNLLLIEDSDRVHIIDGDDFINSKKLAISQAYEESIEKISRGIFYGRRNDTNNRLDTNLTNMAKVLTNKICEHNKLTQFDLCNAQFAILSDSLEDELDTEDFKIFKEQSYNGTLYEYVMDKLDISDRKVAKKMMFELMFSKETFQSELKNKLKIIFPSVVEIVDKYKKENKYNQFSIMLQKREAEIFIDGLWKQIKNKKIFCTPKHDSLIVRKEDEDEVKNIIDAYFQKINFKGKIIKE